MSSAFNIDQLTDTLYAKAAHTVPQTAVRS